MPIGGGALTAALAEDCLLRNDILYVPSPVPFSRSCPAFVNIADDIGWELMGIASFVIFSFAH